MAIEDSKIGPISAACGALLRRATSGPAAALPQAKPRRADNSNHRRSGRQHPCFLKQQNSAINGDRPNKPMKANW